MAEDAYLKIEEIKGECSATHHKDWIEITNFSLDISTDGDDLRTPAKAGKISALKIDKPLDRASPKLAAAACWRTPLKKEVIVELCEAVGNGQNPVTFMQYKLSGDVFIKSYSVSGGGSGSPEEAIEIVYDKITMTYRELDHETGKEKSSSYMYWDITQNKGGKPF